jgi:hypothetical protein
MIKISINFNPETHSPEFVADYLKRLNDSGIDLQGRTGAPERAQRAIPTRGESSKEDILRAKYKELSGQRFKISLAEKAMINSGETSIVALITQAIKEIQLNDKGETIPDMSEPIDNGEELY